MSQASSIRQLLTDAKLGLLPYLDKRLSEIEKSWQQLGNATIEPYNIDFGDCSTISANEPRPLITQSIYLNLSIIGDKKDKIELLLLGSELQNSVDAAIFEWSNREWHQFEKPLKRQVTQIIGNLSSKFLEKGNHTFQVSIYRQFDLIYPLSF
ncbi:MAG TPA: hypothetical protein VK203_00925 [Nostocaceae cyanobacterium]|nr:hypothetical protein [Nostocaceae cyanobacterium]